MSTVSVCVYCSASEEINQRYAQLAFDVGTLLAERNWVCVSGGGGLSSMGVVAQSVRLGGGWTVGVITQALFDAGYADFNADELLIVSGLGERKAEMDRRSDAFLVLPGGLGTLDELLDTWASKALGMHNRPIVVVDPWDDFAIFREQVDAWVASGFVSASSLSRVAWVRSAPEAFDKLAAALPNAKNVVG